MLFTKNHEREAEIDEIKQRYARDMTNIIKVWRFIEHHYVLNLRKNISYSSCFLICLQFLFAIPMKATSTKDFTAKIADHLGQESANSVSRVGPQIWVGRPSTVGREII